MFRVTQWGRSIARLLLPLSILISVALGALAAPLFVSPGSAQAPPTQPALERICAADRIAAEWFAPGFLSLVPLAQVQSALDTIKAEFGRCLRVGQAGTGLVMEVERGILDVTASVDGEGRFTGLLLRPRVPHSSTGEALAAFRALPGHVGLLAAEGGRERVALNADASLAVGSAFKLTVLQALRQEVDAGRRSWGDAVTLRREWKSLPSGTLHTAPEGTEVTLLRLAELMISISDNTATDALIHTLGRGTVEALAPVRNRPFLTTREAFVLKAPENRDLLERYRREDESGRRDALRDAAHRPLPSPGIFAGGPTALDVEWFYTARELCREISAVADLPAAAINPGPAGAEGWARVAYKGGSEPGVLNLTTFLESRTARRYCVVATWNHTERLRDLWFVGLYRGVTELLR
ncbi:MAG: serine hydrolase [bacterium]|nr:serine hydrolase [bacterium]